MASLLSRIRGVGRKRRSEIDEEYWIIPMSIHKLGYEGKDYTVPRYGRLDPGSQVNLVSERILEELDYEYYHNKAMSIFMLGGSELKPVGDITLKWHVEGKPDRVHSTDFTVIAKDLPVSFDFLLGRGWCAETRALIRNLEVLCLDMTRVALTNTWPKADLNLVSGLRYFVHTLKEQMRAQCSRSSSLLFLCFACSSFAEFCIRLPLRSPFPLSTLHLPDVGQQMHSALVMWPVSSLRWWAGRQVTQYSVRRCLLLTTVD
jgi:hypothetical protein